MDHPLCDGTTDRLAVAETLGESVYYSEGLSSFLAWSVKRGLRPVLVTHPQAQVTFPVAYHLLSSDALWLRRVDDGFVDLRSGVTYDSVSDVPDKVEDAGVPAPDLDRSRVWASFTVSVQHPAEETTLLGDVVEVLWQHLTGTGPQGWGWHEPCLSTWDKASYTASARTLMPYGSMCVTGGDRYPAQAVAVARRNHFGVEEVVSGFAVAGMADCDMAALGARMVGALAAVADAVSTPSVGVLSVTHGGPKIGLGIPATDAVMPMAVLVGPRAMRALGSDAKTFASANGGVTAGPGKFPSLVMPLFGSGEGTWQRLRDLIGVFGDDSLANALYLAPEMKGDSHAA